MPLDNTATTDYAALAEQFFDLFAGFQGAHGRCKLTPITEHKPGVKRESDSWTTKTAPTPELWEAHLIGSGPGLGIAMLLDDGKNVLFGCIDIDVYDKMDLLKLDLLRRARGLPLVICKSKSGGAHCYLFLKDPAPATEVQALLARWATALDQPSTCEIFPKQTTRNDGEIGNWLNMPFYNCEQLGSTRRYAVIDGIQNENPVKFLAYARSMQTTLADAQAIEVVVAAPTVDRPERPKPNGEGAGDGNRNNELFRFAGSLVAKGLDDEMALQNLKTMAARCDPPATESDRVLMDMITRARRKKFDANPSEPDDDMDSDYELECMDAGDDDGFIEPREWLLGNTFCKKFFSSLVATGGTGKTSIRILQALGLATGRGNITGEYVFRRSRVLILTFEDDLDELRRRVRAARIHHEISTDDVRGWLFYQSMTGMKMPSGGLMKLASVDKKGNVQEGAFAATLERFIQRNKIDCVILDPFVKTHSVGENGNTEIDFVVSILAGIAIRNNIAIDVPHHTNKQALEAGDKNAARGASSFVDAGRLVYSVTPMTSDEAKRFGILDSDRVDYVRVDNAKVNIIRKKAVAWFKMVSVNLGNGNEVYLKGDNVQAMEPWTPPEALDGLDENIEAAILQEIGNGLPNGQRYSSHHNAKERHVGLLVRKYLPSKTDKQAEEIVGKWLKDSTLTSAEYDDPIRRTKLKGLFVIEL